MDASASADTGCSAKCGKISNIRTRQRVAIGDDAATDKAIVALNDKCK